MSEEDPLISSNSPSDPKKTQKYYINVSHWLYPETAKHTFQSARQQVRHILSSKAGHYFVLALVALDVGGIIADFIINLFKCEKKWGDAGWDEALDAIDIMGLCFSYIFMIELLASIWAFGWAYFHSKFHCVDAIVIVAGFIVDVLLHGPLEEAASLIVILRLWRVFKIIEELSVGAQEQVDHLEEAIEQLQGTNEKLQDENLKLKDEVAKEKRLMEGEHGRLKKEIEKLKEIVGKEGDDS